MPDTPTQKTTAGKAQAEAEGLAQSARDAAVDAAGTVRDQAAAQADSIKQGVADEVSGVASALRTAASEMRDGSPQERTMGQIADGLADASEAIGGKDLGEIARDLSGFARRNPMVFLGGAALLGFAATRFATARTPEPEMPHTATTSYAATTGTAPMPPRGTAHTPPTGTVPASPKGTS